MSSKSLLRSQARARRARLAASLPDFAQRIAAFADAALFTPGAVIAGYWPVQSEADPRALMAALGARGHVLALPRIESQKAPLSFRRWRAGDPLIDNHHRIPEPRADMPVVAPDIILVPLLAFDAAGYRLGYGGGYYDRTISSARDAMPPVVTLPLATPSHRGPSNIGIAYAGQQISSLPRGAHDMALDAILTENGLFKPA
jgi:5-formyltetrahydrofolate cyclo-ligase